jgi:hypothetical protein
MNRLLSHLQSVLLSRPVQRTRNLWELLGEFSCFFLSPSSKEKIIFSKQFFLFQFQQKTKLILNFLKFQFLFRDKSKFKYSNGQTNRVAAICTFTNFEQTILLRRKKC